MFPTSVFRLVTRSFLLTAAMMAGTQTALARSSSDDVRVSVSYDISMPRPETIEQTEAAMTKAREMVYARVQSECDQMQQHFASTCELTQLDIKQHVKSARRQSKTGTITIRASAVYSIVLESAQEKK